MANVQLYPCKTKEITFLAAAARTTTANSGAVQIPEGARAIMFISDQNTVSGTSPTLDISLEISNDAGTTWFGISRFTQVTAAGERFLIQPFLGENVFGTDGVTEANFEFAEAAATGGALVQPCVVPSLMRAVMTIGGTSPSFNGSLIALLQGPVR